MLTRSLALRYRMHFTLLALTTILPRCICMTARFLRARPASNNPGLRASLSLITNEDGKPKSSVPCLLLFEAGYVIQVCPYKE